MRSSLAVLAAGASIVSAAEHPSSFSKVKRDHQNSKRYTTLTGQYQQEVLSSKYTLSNNLWGMYAGSGSQTTRALSVVGDTVEWSTSWSWQGGENSVKSYANLGIHQGLGVTLKEVTSIPIDWSWSRTGNAASANAAVDGWLSNDPSCGYAVGCSTHELMVWIDHTGPAGPAGSSVGMVTVGGLQWELFTGQVQNWKIASFVAKSSIPHYKADLKPFYDHLIKIGQVSPSEYVTAMQAGTEPFEGSGVTLTNKMSMSVLTGGSPAPVPVTTTKAPVTTTKAPVTTTKAPSTTAKPPTTTSKASSSAAPSSSAPASGACGSAYAQCGGIGFSGAKCCVSGYTCTLNNEYYSQCLPGSAKPAVTASTSSKVAGVSSKPIQVVAPSVIPSSVPAPSTGGAAGALGGFAAPAVSVGGRGFVVAGEINVSFHSLEEAHSRACDIQNNLCANDSNAQKALTGTAKFTVADCYAQSVKCHASA